MNRELVKDLFLSLLIVLSQLLIFNHINLFGTVSTFIYVSLFILYKTTYDKTYLEVTNEKLQSPAACKDFAQKLFRANLETQYEYGIDSFEGVYLEENDVITIKTDDPEFSGNYRVRGKKIAFTELIAFGDLRNIIENGQISDRSALIASYALCGFANFGSLGILLGGLNTMVPERREETLEIAPTTLQSPLIHSGTG